MRDFFLKIFSNEIGGPDITLFGFFHILYFLLIVGGTFLLNYLIRNKTQEQKKKVLDIMSLILVILYLGDFLVHPFIHGEQALNVDKLPFHICTCSCILIAITRIFPNYTKRIKTAVTVLGLVGALMYITCPNGAVGPGTKAFSYVIIQTFIYHGILFAYGVTAIISQDVQVEYKKIYVEAIIIACLDLIALGANAAYSSEEHHYDWFFVTGSSFGVSPYLMPFLIFIIIFAMCNAIYLITYGVKKIIEKKKLKTSAE